MLDNKNTRKENELAELVIFFFFSSYDLLDACSLKLHLDARVYISHLWKWTPFPLLSIFNLKLCILLC